MVNTSKILTVSYGTFSCTLEGFDDSFDTMKAIAEYFRDLAADDRYFGATPPTPDADMLARIAEKEIERRVEARQEQGSIVLRASEMEAAAAPALSQPAAPQPAAAEQALLTEETVETAETQQITAEDADDLAQRLDEAAEAEAEIAAEAEAEAAVEEEEAAALIVPRRPHFAKPIQATVAANVIPVPHPDADSVAAKLARIRSVVSREEVAEDVQNPIYTEDEHAEAFMDDSAAHEAMESRLDDDLTDGAIRTAALSYEDEWDEEETAASDAAPEAEAEGLYEEVEEPAAAEAEAEAAEVAANEDEIETEEETVSFDADEFDPEAFSMELNAEVETEVETEIEAEDEDELDAILDRLIHRGAAKTATVDEEEYEEETAEALDLSAYEDTAEDEDAPQVEFETESETATESQPEQPGIRARVMKMKRADFEAAIEKGLLEEDEDAYEAVAEEDESPASTGDLSPEAEAELQRELAEVEAELGDLDDDAAYAEDTFDDEDEDDMELDGEDEMTSIFAEDDEAEEEEAQRQSLRTRLPVAGGEGDMSRLMAKASSEMDEPEGSNRRASIAHLRAAVAATKAEKDAGTLHRNEDQVKAYQDDLASVVRPRRLTVGEGRTTRRPEVDTRPAPLKLVAEQRVDEAPDAAPAQPVRPRRVSMAAEMAETAAPADQHSFVEFAEEMGASSLPELLEAAASYLSFVEGQEQFSRPQLMTKARQIQGEEFSREDGLRSFGMLLRQGKIEKLKGNRFTVSDSIGYRPDARQAG